MGRFQFGQIILARIGDASGRLKERPTLIISSDEENDLGEPLQLIAITKSIEKPCPKYHIMVHDSWVEDPKTGLTAPCVAKCNWVREVAQNAVIRSIGYLPYDVLDAVVSEFDSIYNDESFVDWV